MEQRKNIITTVVLGVLVAILTVCAGVLLSDVEGANRIAPNIVVNEINANTVTGMTIWRNGSQIDLIRENEVWRNADGSTDVDQTLTEAASTFVSYVYASSVLQENQDGLDRFGLDEPWLMVSITDVDGQQIAYGFGSETADRTGVYFVASNDPKVYVMSKENFDQIDKGTSVLKDLSLPITKEEITSIEVQVSGKPPLSMQRIEQEQRVGNETWQMNSPYDALANEDVAKLVEMLLTPTKLERFISQENDAQYGIDKSQWIELRDALGTTVKLWIGDRTEEGGYYCMVEGKDGVYTVYRGYSELIEMEGSNAIHKSILLEDDTHRNSFVWTYGDEEVVFDMQKMTLNGKAVSEERLANIMQALGKFTFEGMTDGTQDKTPVAELKIGQNGKTVSFYPYKNEFLAVGWGGDSPVYVKKSNFEDLYTALKNFA